MQTLKYTRCPLKYNKEYSILDNTIILQRTNFVTQKSYHTTTNFHVWTYIKKIMSESIT